MWELYNLLKNGTGKNHQEYLVDEVYDILDGISKQEFIQSLQLMYDTVSVQNPVQLATMFIVGLKKNSFFVFDEFIKRVGNGRSTIR